MKKTIKRSMSSIMLFLMIFNTALASESGTTEMPGVSAINKLSDGIIAIISAFGLVVMGLGAYNLFTVWGEQQLKPKLDAALQIVGGLILASLPAFLQYLQS